MIIYVHMFYGGYNVIKKLSAIGNSYGLIIERTRAAAKRMMDSYDKTLRKLAE